MAGTVEIGTTRAGVTELNRHWAATDPWSALVIVHGLGEHSGRYERTGTLMAEAGIDTYAFDVQGFGASGGRRAYIERWSTYLDQVLDNLAPAFNSGFPTVLMGHSFGGLVATTYALSLHRQPDLMVLSSPALGANIPGWQRAAAPIFSRILPKVSLPNPIKGEQLSRDPEVGKDYFIDPLVFTKTSFGLGNAILEQMAKAGRSLDAYSARTLVIHGGEDTIVPPEASEAIGELSGVDRTLYPELRHETLNEPEGPDVVADIVSWIRSEVDQTST